MSNIGKSEVNTSYSRNDECSVSASDKKCELKTENFVAVTSAKQDIFNKARCAQYSVNSYVGPDLKLLMCDLTEKDPDYLLKTITELQTKIEYTEKMNWLCKWKHDTLLSYNIIHIDFYYAMCMCVYVVMIIHLAN